MKNFEDFLSEAKRPPMDEKGIESRGKRALRDLQGKESELENRMSRAYDKNVNAPRSKAAARKRAQAKAQGDKIIQDIRDEKKKTAIVRSPGGKMTHEKGKGVPRTDHVKAGGRGPNAGQSRPPSAAGSREKAGQPKPNSGRRVPKNRSIAVRSSAIVPTGQERTKREATGKLVANQPEKKDSFVQELGKEAKKDLKRETSSKKTYARIKKALTPKRASKKQGEIVKGDNKQVKTGNSQVQ